LRFSASSLLGLPLPEALHRIPNERFVVLTQTGSLTGGILRVIRVREEQGQLDCLIAAAPLLREEEGEDAVSDLGQESRAPSQPS